MKTREEDKRRTQERKIQEKEDKRGNTREKITFKDKETK
jgi:hypothetical protein